MKFVHSADVHLDSPLRGLDEYPGAPTRELRGATRQACENLIDLCLEEEARLLIVAGDLYDGDWPDFNTGLYFAQQMARLDAAGIRVVLVRGNHDAASRITKRLVYPKNVHSFSERKPETLLLDELQMAIHGQSFARHDITANLAVGYPEPIAGRFNIGVLHTALEGREGHNPYAPCRVDELRARGYDYWALGHVHQREIVAEEPWIVFPGCLQGRNVRETGAKGCSVVSVQDGRVEAVEFRAMDVLRWVSLNVDAEGMDREDALLSRIADELQSAKRGAEGRFVAVRLQVVGTTALHEKLASEPEHYRQQIRAIGIEAGAGELWVEKVRFLTHPLLSAASQRKREDGIGELLRTVDEVLDDDAVLAELSAVLAPVMDKLPPEFRAGGELTNLRDRETMKELVARAQSLLLARLTTEESR